MTSEHATLEELLGHLVEHGRLPAAVHAHVATCATCGRTLERAERLLAAARVAPVAAPSAEMIDRAWRRIARARLVDRAIARAGEALETVVAALVGDSTEPSPAVRGATTAVPRVLVYETDDVGISISLAGHGESEITLKGQVMPRHDTSLPDGGRVVIAAGDHGVELSLGAFGEFDAGTLPRETLHLVFVIGSARIELPAVPVGGVS
jgi:hypothetical protein